MEINPIRGKRLRSLLEKHNMEQQELANKIGYTKEHISYIVNGKRNLTQEAADAIVKIFPGTRIGWLLGYDDCETNDDAVMARAQEVLDGRDAIIELMRYAANLLGYQFEWAKMVSGNSEEGPIEEYNPDEVRFDLMKGHIQFEITLGEEDNFADELVRYAVFLLEGLIHKKNDTWHPFSIGKEILDNG